MKDILKQIVWILIGLVCCVIQLVSLTFAVLAWGFRNVSELLDDVSVTALKKYDATTEEKTSEEAPVEGVVAGGDSA